MVIQSMLEGYSESIYIAKIIQTIRIIIISRKYIIEVGRPKSKFILPKVLSSKLFRQKRQILSNPHQ